MSLPTFAAEGQETTYDRIVRTGEIKCGYIPWAPYYEVDLTNGEVYGIGKEITDLVFKVLDLKPVYIEATLGHEVLEMKAGKYDAVCGVGPWVISKIKHVNYADPLWYFPIHAYARTDDMRFKKESDLNHEDVSFLGLDEDLSTELVSLKYSKAQLRTLSASTDPAQMMVNVATGKADVLLMDPLTVTTFEKTNPGKIKPLFDGQILALYHDSFAVKKEDLVLLETLNEAIRSVHDTGLMYTVFDKYPKYLKEDLLLLPSSSVEKP